MTWQSVGTHTFVPTDKAVQVGSFDLAAGQDTIWVRITQLNDPGDWPWSYGILSWRNANGTPLGSTKAYSNRLGEVFRLGNGLAPLDGVGSLWFEPRGFNLGWLKAGFPWELQFEAQAGAGDMNSGYWNRDNNGVVIPKTSGDSLDLGTGDLSAADGTFNGTIISGVAPAPDFANTGVGIYKDGAVYIKRVNPDGEDFLRCIYNDSARFKLVANGDAQKLAAGQWSGISDVRAKNSITDYTAGLQEVVALRPVNYRLNGLDHDYIGLIAQEAEKVMPEMVTSAPGEIDGVSVQDKRTLDPTAIQYALVNAVKEMAARIEALEAEVSP